MKVRVLPNKVVPGRRVCILSSNLREVQEETMRVELQALKGDCKMVTVSRHKGPDADSPGRFHFRVVMVVE